MLLYDFPRSGNCHKIRMLLSMLGMDYEKREVDLLAAEQLAPSFESVNPLRQVPVLVDGETVIRDSQAILVYLASTYGRQWLPASPEGLGHAAEWLAFAGKEIASSLPPVRLYHLTGEKTDIETAARTSERVLFILEMHLQNRSWLVEGLPSVADIACFPYVALSHEARISLSAYPAVRAWINRIRALPGYVEMPGLEGAPQLPFRYSDRLPFMSANWMALAREMLQASLIDAPSLSQGSVRIVERLRNAPSNLACSHGGEARLFIGIENGHANVAYFGSSGHANGIEIVCEWEDAQHTALMHAGPELDAFRAWQLSEKRVFICGDVRPVSALLGAVHDRLAGRSQAHEG
ncbi:glutathione S-transferase family protein [Agrobacterium tumefaciens]|uniref:glutathione S-transferase family protein n=1 Tax=Agrobacterium tumefaciens TaxID=358 RepID=UPI001573C92C|nr:glutathione S-transferase family protein [Agrobacterium tumefaciens]